MREVISLHVGQAGTQLGSAIWELMCSEHNIKPSGEPMFTEAEVDDSHFETFFQETKKNRYMARSIFVDLEPIPVDEIRQGSYRGIHHPHNLITGQEDAANIFSRGCFTLGKDISFTVAERIRRCLEASECVQGIMIFRSLGGGTGSGLTSAIFDYIADYSKISRVELPIYPSPTLSTSTVEPYNSVMSEHFCMEDVDLSLMFDNEAIYEICGRFLSMANPTYTNLNRIIAQVTSTITASSRYQNTLNNDVNVMQTNLVPYPRIHFPIINYAPLLNTPRGSHEKLTLEKITRYLFLRENQMVKCCPQSGRFMSCAIVYRGAVSPQEVYKTLVEIKTQRSGVDFVEWCPTGFKIGIVNQPSKHIRDGLISPSKTDAVMVANNTAVSQVIKTLTQKFAMLYSKRSFVHWYVGEGLEEIEFSEALYNIVALVKDYEEAGMDVPPSAGSTGTPAGLANDPIFSKEKQEERSDAGYKSDLDQEQIAEGSPSPEVGTTDFGTTDVGMTED